MRAHARNGPWDGEARAPPVSRTQGSACRRERPMRLCKLCDDIIGSGKAGRVWIWHGQRALGACGRLRWPQWAWLLPLVPAGVVRPIKVNVFALFTLPFLALRSRARILCSSSLFALVYYLIPPHLNSS